MNTHTIVTDIHQNMLRTHQDGYDKSRLVSDARALEIQNRSAALTTQGSNVLYLHLA